MKKHSLSAGRSPPWFSPTLELLQRRSSLVSRAFAAAPVLLLVPFLEKNLMTAFETYAQQKIEQVLAMLLEKDPKSLRFGDNIRYSTYELKGEDAQLVVKDSFQQPVVSPQGTFLTFSTGTWYQPALARYQGPSFIWEACLKGQGEFFEHCTGIREVPYWAYVSPDMLAWVFSRLWPRLRNTYHFRIECQFQTPSVPEIKTRHQRSGVTDFSEEQIAFQELLVRRHYWTSFDRLILPRVLEFFLTEPGGSERSTLIEFPPEYPWEIPALRYDIRPDSYRQEHIQERLFSLCLAFCVWGVPEYIRFVRKGNSQFLIPEWVKTMSWTLGRDLEQFLGDLWRVRMYHYRWLHTPASRWYRFG